MKDVFELCYALYKEDWLRRISAKRKMEALREAYIGEYTSLEEYLNDNGFSGELYVCPDEFRGAEFIDKDYIKELLGDEALYCEYLKYLSKADSSSVKESSDNKMTFTDFMSKRNEDCKGLGPGNGISDAEFRRFSIDYLLEENWYTTDAFSQEQINEEAIYDILKKYSKRYKKEMRGAK